MHLNPFASAAQRLGRLTTPAIMADAETKLADFLRPLERARVMSAGVVDLNFAASSALIDLCLALGSKHEPERATLQQIGSLLVTIDAARANRQQNIHLSTSDARAFVSTVAWIIADAMPTLAEGSAVIAKCLALSSSTIAA